MFFFFNDTATTEIYTLSLHDALPIFSPLMESADLAKLLRVRRRAMMKANVRVIKLFFKCFWFLFHSLRRPSMPDRSPADRKSTRLNSSHLVISYAVFCLKKKKAILVDDNVVVYVLSYKLLRIRTIQTLKLHLRII